MGDIHYNIKFEEVLEGMHKAGGEELAGKLESIWVAFKMLEKHDMGIHKEDGIYKLLFANKDYEIDVSESMLLSVKYAKGMKHVAEIGIKYKKIFLNVKMKNDYFILKETDKRKVGVVLDEALKKLAVM